MDWSSILAGTFGILSVVVGTRLTYVNQQNIKLREGLNKKKQKAYVDLIELINDLQEGDDQNLDENIAKLKKYFKQILYYGSPGVLKALGDYMQFIYNEFDDSKNFDEDQTNLFHHKLYGELVVQMRKDLGHVKWFESESWLDVLRLTITDIDQYVPESSRKSRGSRTQPPIVINKKQRL
jgi:hypothetical protein